jgi:hypothetical protein
LASFQSKAKIILILKASYMFSLYGKVVWIHNAFTSAYLVSKTLEYSFFNCCIKAGVLEAVTEFDFLL